MKKEALTAAALEALLHAPSLAIHAVDKQGCVILWSPSASRMFGWTESEVLGRFLPIVPEDRRQEVYDRIQRDLKGESISPLDVRRLRKDGSLIDINLWSAPLRDTKGEVIGILGLYADITARKRAEGALQQTEAELHRVLAAVSDCVYSGEFDSDGQFFYHYYSPVTERIMGRPPLFFLVGPERWLRAVHPEDRPRLAQAFAGLRTGQSASAEEEYRIILPDGAIRWVRDSVTQSQGTDGRRFINGVVSDITARKRAEEALRESELELRRVLDAASDYFWSGDIDREGRFRYRYYSPAVERITGRPAEFYMAGSERWMSTVHSEDRARISEISERLLSGQSVSCEYEYRIILPDRTIRWLRANTTVSPSADGHRRVDGVVSDITARKQSEEALREGELELRRVLGAASDYFWSGDIDREGRFRYRYYSPAVERITGRPSEFYMAGSERWMSTVHPEDRARLAEISARMLSGQLVSSENEHRIILPDGTIRWVRAHVTVSQPADGYRRLDGVVSDITARKQAEEALRESEARFRGIFTAAASGIVLVSPGGRFLHANPAFCEFLGYSEQELLSKNVQDITHPNDREGSAKITREIWEGERPLIRRYEKRYCRKDGQTVWGEVSISLIRDAMGKASYTVAHVLDVTDRKKTEAALEESEQRFRALIEHGSDVIAVIKADGTIQFTSVSTACVLGYQPHELVGRNAFNLIHPEDLPRVTDAFHRLLQTPGRTMVEQFRCRHKDGSWRWVETLGTNCLAQPAVGGIILNYHDITEQKHAEERLEERVRERTAELAEANKALQLQGTALQAAANGIVITDREGDIVWANPAFTKLTGYELSEVIGGDLRVLRSGQHSKAFYRNLWQTPLSGRVWHGEIVNKRKDGSLYTEEMTITPVRDAAGEIAHFIFIKQDITEWKLAEESRRHLAAIVEYADEAIVSSKLDGTLTSWNAGAQRLYDYAAEEMLGRRISVLVPRNRRGEAEEFRKKVLCGEHIQHYDTVRLKKGGIPVDVAVTVSPLKNAAGKIIGISAIIRDITERKELERAIVEVSSREQRRIGQDLHDGLCQQLTGISFLWKAIAQTEAVRALPKDAEVAEISQLITKTIIDARDLAQGLCPVELERNDLGVALKNLALSMERLFAVACDVRCQQPVLLADKTVAVHLYRIAQEAISNAIHHGKAARVWIHLVWKKNRLVLRIRDDGSGFSKRRDFKEGIGMRSMKYRAQVIGGSLTIESKRGAGTTVACVCTQPRSRLCR